MNDEGMRFPSAMSQRDALMWHMERNPLLKSTIVVIAILDEAPETSKLDATLERAIDRIPRLRQRVASPASVISTPSWVDVPEIDLGHHRMRVRAPGAGHLDDVLDLASTMAMQAFDVDRPLWEFVLVEGLSEGRAALIQKLHHSISDGVGGVQLMGELYDLSREANGERPAPPPSEPATSQASEHDAMVRGAAALLRQVAGRARQLQSEANRMMGADGAPLEGITRAADELKSVARLASPAHAPLSPVMVDRSPSFRYGSFSVPLDSLRRAAHAACCRINDAFVASVAAGLRHYHASLGAETNDLRMAIPINLRDPRANTAAGNEIMVARLPIPIGETDPMKRMLAIRHRIRELRNESGIRHAELLAGLVNLVPRSLSLPALASQATNTDFVASCVTGPPVPMFCAGSGIEHLYAFGPPAGAAVNVTLFSYLDRAQIGLNIDPAAVPDRDLLVACMKEGFGEVLKLA